MRKIMFNVSMSGGAPRQVEGWVTPLSPYLVIHEVVSPDEFGWTVTHLLSGMSASNGRKVSSPEEAVKLLEDLVAVGIDWSQLDPRPSILALRGTPAFVQFMDKLNKVDRFSTEVRDPVRQLNEVTVGEGS